MKQYLFFAFIFLLACTSQQERMTEAEKQQIADSIFESKKDHIQDQAATDLDHRKAIEVKAKADSIVEMGQNPVERQTAPADNTIPNNLTTP